MKPLLSLFLLLLIGPVLTAQTGSMLQEFSLRGPVKSIRTETETTNTETPNSVPIEITVFDERGNVTLQEGYKPDGSLKFRSAWRHEYDERGREVKTLYYDAEGAPTYTGVSVFDEKDRVTQTTLINPDGSINHIRAYFYDEKGNLIREAHRNANGSARVTINRSYNERGEVTDEVYLGPDGALHHRSVMSRDDHGQQVGWGLLEKDGTFVQAYRSSNTYDEQGNIKGTTTYRSDKAVTHDTFSYEFDVHGNWTKRTVRRELIKEGRSQAELVVAYRTITYF